jgi:RNA polymerase sigma-70 factor, ECF subfamily
VASDLLGELYHRAREAWPGVKLDRAVFEAFVAARLPDPPTPQAVAAIAGEDLYLVCACLRWDPAALSTFDRAFADAIGHSLSRFDLSSAERDDIVQSLRVTMFVNRKLESYSGTGPLRGWVRSSATRAALRVVGSRKQRPDASEDILGALPATGDPELDLMRSRFAAEFRQAFAETVASMGAEDRLVLRQHYVDDLSIDQLAVLHRIHRATAARRVSRLRAALLAGTRERLEQVLDIDATQLESLMRLAGSRLQVSVFRLLKR